MSKLYVVEPRNADGTLNVKDDECFLLWRASGVTEDELFDYYFRFHPHVPDCKWRCTCSASWEQLREFLGVKGWHVREKYW